MSLAPSKDIGGLLAIMAALRTPGTGCSWDVEQTFASIAPYTIEEAYEVADAIERGDLEDLRDELGDLLLQVVFHAQMADEKGAFAFPDVVEAISAKMIRRHPHVFGTARDLAPEDVKRVWATVKQGEKAERRARRGTASQGHLDAVSTGLPPLQRAVRLQAKASEVGFDWNDARLVLDKIKEEAEETAEALVGGGREAIQDEIGDLLFAVVNLARHAGVDPETALRAGNAKFVRRFGHVERSLATAGSSLSEATLAQMEELWTEAKRNEREVG